MEYSGQNDEQDYVDAFQRGEEKGFTYFFNAFYPALLYFAVRILNDKPTAEDVVAEAFVKIWERHSTFSHPKVIKSWLYTTVRNGSLTKRQQAQRSQTQQDQFARTTEGESENFVLNEIIRAEVLRELHAQIESLPTACRKIFQKLYIEGKSVREVAVELKLSISTIKNQKARGLGLLRKKFPAISVILTLQVLQQL